MQARVSLELDEVREAETLLEELQRKVDEAHEVLEQLQRVTYRMGVRVKIEQPPERPAAAGKLVKRVYQPDGTVVQTVHSVTDLGVQQKRRRRYQSDTGRPEGQDTGSRNDPKNLP